MSPAPAVSQSSFEFLGGDPALDFVNTADWTADGPVNERLGGYADLVRWGRDAGLLSPEAAARLGRLAAGRPGEARAVYAAALETRDLLARLFAATIGGKRAAAPLRQFNELLAKTLERLELVEGVPARWRWRGLDRRLESVLWPVIRSAADLLASEDAAQLRMCAGPDCGWLYVDRSRNGLRRWCQMRTCGTREKSRRRRAGVA